jgi:aryl-alcohol dehydrogenase-like predicted oxidoreductase
MEYRLLGRTGIRVSRLCFGSLTIGPLQANLSVREGARLIELALDKGVNFIDTADLYGTYPQIKRAIRHRKEKPVLASKSYAYSKEGMYDSLQRALSEMDVPCVDIFLLHEQESHLTLKGHREALEYLLEAKRDGLVRAVGFSCHTVAALVAAQSMPEIDVVHPLINVKGVGIRDGTVEDALRALAVLHKRGTGVFAMKPLGGGHLIGQSKEAFHFVRSQPHLDSVAVGMASPEEIEYNCALFANEDIPDVVGQQLSQKRRRLQIHHWCTGCASCQSHCPQDALRILDGKMSVYEASCVLCGYCGAHCPDFCLKIY